MPGMTIIRYGNGIEVEVERIRMRRNALRLLAPYVWFAATGYVAVETFFWILISTEIARRRKIWECQDECCCAPAFPSVAQLHP